MQPVRTDYSNITYVAEGCFDLPATLAEDEKGAEIETVWELTDEEIEQIRKGRRVYLYVKGRAMPPVFLAAEPYFDIHA